MPRRCSGTRQERWHTVVGFPLYEVSDCGRVRRNGRVLKSGKQSNSEHRYVILRRGGFSLARRVHTLVAAAFIGPCPVGCEVDHKDFDPTNNHAGNLQYITHAENNRRSARAGRIKPPVLRGEKANGAKLVASVVRAIRRHYKAGTAQPKLAEMYGITQGHISAIVRRKAWAHVA